MVFTDLFRNTRGTFNCVMAPCFPPYTTKPLIWGGKIRSTVMPSKYKPRGFPSRDLPIRLPPLKLPPIMQRPVSANPLTGSWSAQSFLSTYGIYILIFIIVLGIYYYRVYLPKRRNLRMSYNRNYR